MLSLDLGLFNRKAHTIKHREAVAWSIVWVTFAMIFAGIVFWTQGKDLGLKFLTGYVIELSLSVDNLFVFLLIFAYFKVPSRLQHRVLFWGVMGALVMRLTMIFIGATLIDRFHWIIYIFGAFLVYVFWRLGAARELGRVLAAARVPVANRVRPLAWGLTAALAGTMAANLFYLTMQFYYFYAFAILALALPVVFGRVHIRHAQRM